MDQTKLPPRGGGPINRWEVFCNLLALLGIAVGIVLLVRAYFHSFTLDWGMETDLDRRKRRETQTMDLWTWPVFAVASAALAVRRRWITAALFFLTAPVSAALAVVTGGPWIVLLLLLVGFGTWLTIERRGIWGPLAARRP